MHDTGALTVFVIVSFLFAYAVRLRRESLPERARRPLALLALILVAVSFILLIMTFFSMS